MHLFVDLGAVVQLPVKIMVRELLTSLWASPVLLLICLSVCKCELWRAVRNSMMMVTMTMKSLIVVNLLRGLGLVWANVFDFLSAVKATS